uniref:Uncharacterized protein n=1 Tax=Nelumbo nucifera TaxID=4432 RepID=A0A823A0R6_NELNU|nr:TPA_asm: hypothetical protein HUJ06_017705 [Nelumbo nucifera]
MEMYGLPAPDFFRIDDLLDFSNDGDLFSSSSSSSSSSSFTPDPDLLHLPPTENNTGNRPSATADTSNRSNSFTDDLCVPVCTSTTPYLRKSATT